jgi:hypothetical protein
LNVADLGSGGNFHGQVFTGFPGFVFALTTGSIPGFQELSYV